VVSSGVQLPASVVAGVIFSNAAHAVHALAGVDLNNDGSSTTDFVLERTAEWQSDNAAMLTAVNAYRLSPGPRRRSLNRKIDTSMLKRVDLRMTKGFQPGKLAEVELVGQCSTCSVGTFWRHRLKPDHQCDRFDVRSDSERPAASAGRNRDSVSLVIPPMWLWWWSVHQT